MLSRQLVAMECLITHYDDDDDDDDDGADFRPSSIPLFSDSSSSFVINSALS